jgi:hypothetical protein
VSCHPTVVAFLILIVIGLGHTSEGGADDNTDLILGVFPESQAPTFYEKKSELVVERHLQPWARNSNWHPDLDEKSVFHARLQHKSVDERCWEIGIGKGGLRVPAIISWPGHLPENEVRGQMATGCDWYPTILELCQLPAAKHRIDGKSLLPILAQADAPSAHQNFYWKFRDAWLVREGKWKLIVSTKKTELYDIPNDTGEATNLAAEYPEVVTQLANEVREYESRAVLYK